MINGLILTPMKVIDVVGDSVLRAMSIGNVGYNGFGEAYFSTVKHNTIRGWKKHKEMTLNIVVPVGVIRFVVYDDRKNSSTFGSFQEFILSKDNYNRITIPPNVWVGFQGVGSEINLLLNIANIPHNDTEVDHAQLKSFGYDWTQE